MELETKRNAQPLVTKGMLSFVFLTQKFIFKLPIASSPSSEEEPPSLARKGLTTKQGFHPFKRPILKSLMTFPS